MYEIDNIYLADCYKAIKEIPDKSVDLIVTDPPYLIDNTIAGGGSELAKSIQKMNDELEEGIFTQSIQTEILEDFIRICKNTNIYIWCNHKQIPLYLDFFVEKKGCSFDILIWNKTNALPLFNNKYLTDKEYCLYFRKNGYCNPLSYENAKTVYYLPININDKNKFGHPTIKPSLIMKNIILNSSKEGDVVFDPFMGSGTTAVCAKQLNRHFLGFEIDEKWHKIATNRLNGEMANGQQSFLLI